MVSRCSVSTTCVPNAFAGRHTLVKQSLNHDLKIFPSEPPYPRIRDLASRVAPLACRRPQRAWASKETTRPFAFFFSVVFGPLVLYVAHHFRFPRMCFPSRVATLVPDPIACRRTNAVSMPLLTYLPNRMAPLSKRAWVSFEFQYFFPG